MTAGFITVILEMQNDGKIGTWRHSPLFIPTCILHLTRSLCHVRNTRKDSYIFYAQNTPSHHAKKITVVYFMFVCCFHAHAHTFFPFLLLITSVRSCICSLSLSLSFAHSRSLLTNQNIQFDVAYTRKLRLHPLVHICVFYIHNTYIYVHINSRILLKVCTYEV